MKWLVNGVETEFSAGASDATVGRLSDRLTVRTASGTSSALVAKSGSKVIISYRGQVFEIEKKASRSGGSGAASTGDFTAPMPGLIIDVLVVENEEVRKGQKLLVLEAMKTQQPINSPFDGRVSRINVVKGEQVTEGKLMISVIAAEN